MSWTEASELAQPDDDYTHLDAPLTWTHVDAVHPDYIFNVPTWVDVAEELS